MIFEVYRANFPEAIATGVSDSRTFAKPGVALKFKGDLPAWKGLRGGRDQDSALLPADRRTSPEPFFPAKANPYNNPNNATSVGPTGKS